MKFQPKDFIIPAQPGYYLLVLWGNSFDDDPHVEAMPIVAWNVRLGSEYDRPEQDPSANAAPVVPGWQGNEDRDLERNRDYCILMPDGRVENADGDTFKSVEIWADGTMFDRMLRRRQAQFA